MGSVIWGKFVSLISSIFSQMTWDCYSSVAIGKPLAHVHRQSFGLLSDTSLSSIFPKAARSRRCRGISLGRWCRRLLNHSMCYREARIAWLPHGYGHPRGVMPGAVVRPSGVLRMLLNARDHC